MTRYNENPLEERINCLAEFLGINSEDIEEGEYGFYSQKILEADGNEYLVLTDEEAYSCAKEYILESIWAFRPSFLEAHTIDRIDQDIIKSIQESKYEDANEPLKKMIKDLDHFVNDAISADGRGHFISQYDGEENQGNNTKYFIYRVN